MKCKGYYLKIRTEFKKQINYEKELLFTKRIYHTHHKAEKVMGFIKEDLRILSPNQYKRNKIPCNKVFQFCFQGYL